MASCLWVSENEKRVTGVRTGRRLDRKSAAHRRVAPALASEALGGGEVEQFSGNLVTPEDGTRMDRQPKRNRIRTRLDRSLSAYRMGATGMRSEVQQMEEPVLAGDPGMEAVRNQS